MSDNGDGMEIGEEMEWENSFDLPDRNIPEPIPVNNIINLVTSADSVSEETRTESIVSKSSGCQLIIVPDTNIWMSSTGLLDQLLTANFEEVGKPHILIPWMVLQELDGLMKGPRQGVAQISVRYIDKLLSSKHPRVRGQKPTEVTSAQEKFSGSNEDDSILQCALLCCDKTSDSTVVFLTDDRNLRNKAMVLDSPNLIVTSSLTAFKEIEKKFRLQKEAVRKGNLVQNVPKHVDEVKHAYKSSVAQDRSGNRLRPEDETDRRANKRKIVKAKRSLKPETSAKVDLPLPSVPPRSNTSLRPPSPKRTKRIHPSTSTSPSSTRSNTADLNLGLGSFNTDHKNIFKDPQSSKTDDFTTITDLLKNTLSYIIEFQMKEDCGRENWRSALKIKPPWSLRMALKCIDVHWISIFTYVFGKGGDKSLRRLTQDLDSYQTAARDIKFLNSPKKNELQRQVLESALSLFNSGKIAKPLAAVLDELPTKTCIQALMDYLQEK